MPYQPYPILDFNTGLFSAKEPWISPKDAFTSIQNGRADKGVLLKRRGYSVFATHGTVNEKIATGDGTTTAYTASLFLSSMYENSGAPADYDDASTDDSGSWSTVSASIVHDGIVDPPEDSTYTITASADNGTAERSVTTVSGEYYRISVNISRDSVDSKFRLLFDGSSVLSSYEMEAVSGNAIWQQTFIANSTGPTTYGVEVLNNTEAVTLDEISIYEVTAIGDIKTDGLLAGDANIIISDGVESFTDDGLGTLTGDLGGSGTIAYTTGQYALTFNTAPLDGSNITANYRFDAPDRPVMGLPNYLAGNDPNLLRFDTEQAFALDENNQIFKEIAFALDNTVQEFTGDESDFFWTQNWADILYVTNNTDQIQMYSGDTLSDFDIDINDDELNDIDTALMIFVYKSRIMLLRTTEGGKIYFQRARWSDVSAGGVVTWSDEFVDAPTEEIIVSAGFLNEDLIVFFESSVWKLVYTGDTALPFRWERISDFQGAPSTFGLVTFTDKLAIPGQFNILGATSSAVFGLDQRIPREILKFQQDKADLTYGIRIDETNEAIFTFVSPSNIDGFPDAQVVLNFDNNSYHLYDLPINCLGQTVVNEDLILDEIEEILDTIDVSFDDESLQAGFPLTVFGDKDGVVHRYNTTTADNEEAIDFNVKTIQLNPATAQGVSVRLGYIDFLVTADPDNTMEITLFLNQETSPYLTETVDFQGEGDKVWKRVYSGAVSNFHQIGIQNNTSTDDVEIHAIVPYFDIAGSQI